MSKASFLVRVVLAVEAVVLLMAVAAIAYPHADPAQSPGRVCFPPSKWSAYEGARPCVVLRVYEDGTYQAHTERADGGRWIQR